MGTLGPRGWATISRPPLVASAISSKGPTLLRPGTEGSNPAPSSGESRANLRATSSEVQDLARQDPFA
jgi:hypothetical protein